MHLVAFMCGNYKHKFLGQIFDFFVFQSFLTYPPRVVGPGHVRLHRPRAQRQQGSCWVTRAKGSATPLWGSTTPLWDQKHLNWGPKTHKNGRKVVKSVVTQVYFDVARRKMPKFPPAPMKTNHFVEKTGVVDPGHVRPHGPGAQQQQGSC